MSKNKKILLFIFCYISYTCTYIVRLNLSMAAPGLRTDGIFTSAQIGILGSVFSIMYATGRIINGSLCERIKPRYMMAAGLIAAGICNLGFSTLPPFAGVAVLWGVNAFALSMLWGAVQSVIFTIYQGEEGRMKMSIMASAVATGNIAGIVLAIVVVAHLGSRAAFAVPGIIIIVVGAIDFFLYRKVGFYYNEEEMKKESTNAVTAILQLFRRKEMRLASVGAVCHGVMKENISIWMALIFVDIYGMDLSSNAWYVVLIPVVGFVGRIVFPVFFKKCHGDEMKLGWISFCICAVCSVILCIKSFGAIASILAISVMYAGISIINTTLVSIFPSRFTAERHMNTVAGIMDTMTYAGGAVLSLIYGFTVGKIGYIPMFISWGVFAIIGILALRKVKVTN